MLARILVTSLVAAPIFAATRQNDPHAAPPAGKSEKTAAALFEEAARKLDEASSFFARYEVKADEFAATIQFAYEAPDRASLRFTSPDGDAQTWILDGHLSARIRTGQGLSWGDFDLAAEHLLRGELERAIDELLPETERNSADLGPGPLLSLDFVAPGEGGKEVDFKTAVSWATHCRHVAGWIAETSEWEDARIEGPLLIDALSPTVDLSLSTETGFQKEVRGQKSSARLVECRIDSELDADVFVVPAPAPGAVDRTDEMRKALVGGVRRGERVRLYHMASKAADARKADDSSWRDRVERALIVYHAAALERHHGSWLDKMHARMDLDFDTARAQLESSPNDESVRKQVIVLSADWRKQLEDMLAKSRESYAASLSTSDWAKADIAHAAEIATVELEAALEAFEQAIAQPLFTRYDTGFEQVLARR